MDRRTFLGTGAGSLLASPLAVEGQQAANVHRIGVVPGANPDLVNPLLDTFRRGMHDLGYAECGGSSLRSCITSENSGDAKETARFGGM
jgi:hypothetical protein